MLICYLARHFQTSFQCLYSSRFCDWANREPGLLQRNCFRHKVSFQSIIKSGSFINSLHSYPFLLHKKLKTLEEYARARNKKKEREREFRIFRKVLIFFTTDSSRFSLENLSDSKWKGGRAGLRFYRKLGEDINK